MRDTALAFLKEHGNKPTYKDDFGFYGYIDDKSGNFQATIVNGYVEQQPSKWGGVYVNDYSDAGVSFLFSFRAYSLLLFR